MNNDRLMALLPPPQRSKHKEDRYKAIASVLQTFALSAWGLGIVTPLISGTGPLTPMRAVTCFFLGAALEAISLTFLAYIPYPEDKTEAKTNG